MKCTVIGGGSYNWAFGFARQFVRTERLRDVHLVLVDTNREALDLVGMAADICNRAQGSPIRIERTQDLDAALDGADFVIVSISTGGLAAMRHDLEIPERYGIFHTVGDTVGPGGWLRAVRNVPVFHDFGARMARLCPSAWLMNVSNPLTPLTRVPQRYFGIKTVGMCPGVEHGARAYARLAGAAPDSRLDFVVSGIDHGSWFLRLYADGMDVLQKLKDMGYWRSDDRLPSDMKADDPVAAAHAGIRAAFAVWREIGYLPSLSDRHTTENWPWFLASDNGELPFGIKRTSIADRQEWFAGAKARLERYVQTQDPAAIGGAGHGDDPVVTTIEALAGKRSFFWASNYMNVGQIPGVPEGAVVETRCLFDAAGVHPLASPMPDLLKTLVLPHVWRQELITGIALAGTFDDLVALVTTDPLCSRLPMGKCRDMVREMLSANRTLIRNPKLLEW
ncbi:MAG: hypothetical protein A3K19_23365 [Lentisphaerae bacterium RIFOXYB12_FULL_65_16]|nr:MAG: hypothetical protein A3K18_26320 [Lentisphaerae bacterium RIFOXYA12_64_32]OGV87504.1 MAG: hypothetical protein A3K19_23365 [Lentisphaerae bacterium RIFOXYB12_FULL_65_16]